MKKQVESVLGKINTSDLGFTLMHEHVMVLDWTMRLLFEDWFEREVFIDRAVEIAKKSMEAGVKTIVDLTAINMGRDIHIMKEISERSGLQIIPCTGLYYNEDPWINRKDPNFIADLFVRDIQEGIQGTDIKAAIIKCGTDSYGFSPINMTTLKAVGIAGRITNAPIYTHTIASTKMGLKQQEILANEGVDLKRVVIGHSGDTNDLDYIEELIKNGSYIGLDRFGSDHIFSEEDRINNVVKLVEKGYIDKLILSHDWPLYFDHGTNYWNEAKNVDIDSLKIGYWFISRNTIPELLKRGLTQKDIDKMMIDNPRTFFEY